MVSRLGVIPARGGSTRLKDKNIHPLGGKPLVAHTIEAVLDSGCFDKVLVSTDSPQIAEVAGNYGVEVYDRPAEYSGARVTVVEALIAMMRELDPCDILAYFLPTCPFRNADDIRGGVALMNQDVDSVISISKYSEPPQLALLRRGDDVIPMFDNLKAGLTNSLYMTPIYKPNGGYYMGWWDRILENGNFFTGVIKGFEIPKDRIVDVDDKLDMEMAELVYKYQQGRVGNARE